MALPKLQVLDDEKLRDLDRDVAEKYFEMHNIPKPVLPAVELKENTMMGENDEDAEPVERKAKTTKRVKFGTAGNDIDDDHEGDWQTVEIKKLEQRSTRWKHSNFLVLKTVIR